MERESLGDLVLNAPRRACVRGGYSKDDTTSGPARRAARARDDVRDVRGAVGVLVSRGAVTRSHGVYQRPVADDNTAMGALEQPIA